MERPVAGKRRAVQHAHARRTRLALALVAAMTLALTACSENAGSGGSETNAATIPIEADDSPNYILPSDPQCTSVNNHLLKRLMYMPLYWYGGVPGEEFSLNDGLSLAEAPQFSDGGKQVTVTLKDFSWSDGEPVTARDVVFFVNLFKATKEKWGCYAPGGLPDNITKMTIQDEKTVVFTLDRAYNPEWFTSKTLAGITPLPHHVWGKESANAEVGDADMTPEGAKAVWGYLDGEAKKLTEYADNPLWQVVDGPWKLDEFDPRGDIVFAPNDSYSGADKAKLSQLVMKRYTSDQAEFNGLLAGEALTTGWIPTEDADRAPQIEAQGYDRVEESNFGISYVVLNHNSNDDAGLFRQLYIRQALQQLINQKEYIDVAYNGNAAPVQGPIPMYPDNPFVSDYVKSDPYGFDPAAAKQLLEDHGWTVNPDGVSVCDNPGPAANQCGPGVPAGKELQFRLVYAKSTPVDRYMQAFQSEAAKLGIDIQIRGTTLDQTFALTNECKRGSDLCDWEGVSYGGWTFDPYPSGEDLFMTPGLGNYSDPKADALILDSLTKESGEPLTAYEDYIAEQLPALWLPRAQSNLNVVRSDLEGYERTEQSLFGDIYAQYWHFSQ